MFQASARNIEELVAKDTQPSADLFAELDRLGCSEIHFKRDAASQLEAIIAIHSTRRGPAVGGCRCRSYATTADAVDDACRLARGMSYKGAIAGLPIGGGKAVVMLPERLRDREALFESFGDFVDSLNGRYRTAVDSGTGIEDMDVVARRTAHVLCCSKDRGGSGDPSPLTAKGVRMGIAAAVKHRLNRDDLDGIHVAVQGVGHVGYPLARELSAHGARLTVADTQPGNLQRCADEFGARIATPESIVDLDCDVFSPCALGPVVNHDTVKRFNARIIAGAANNQLESETHGQLLHRRGILYVPDYIINSGGLIHVVVKDHPSRQRKLAEMVDTLMTLFVQSERSGIPPFRQADLLAAGRLATERIAA